MMVTGILRSRSGQLTKIASKVCYPNQKTSLVDRFRRLVRNENIIVDAAFNPVAQLFLSCLSQERLVLTIDSTKMGGNCISLTISVLYKSRALPLVWVVFKGRKGHSSQTLQLELFEMAKTFIPDGCEVILLGDGEFDGSRVIEWLEAQPTWDYVCRTDETTLVFYDGKWLPLKQVPLQPGQETLLEEVLFTQSHQIGPITMITLTLLIFWRPIELSRDFFPLRGSKPA